MISQLERAMTIRSVRWIYAAVLVGLALGCGKEPPPAYDPPPQENTKTVTSKDGKTQWESTVPP